MYKYFTSILLLLLCNFAFGQEKTIPKNTNQEEIQTTFTNSIPDSIQTLLNKKNYTKEERVDALIKTLDYLSFITDLTNMKPYVEELEEISESSNDLYYKALYNYYNGMFLSKDNSFSVIESYFRSLKQLNQLPENYKNQILKINIYNAIGIYYTTNNMLLEAYEAFKKGLELNKKTKISQLDFKLKKNLAVIYIKIGLNQEGFMLNNELLNEYKNNQKEDLINRSFIFNNIGGYYYDKKEYDSAMIYLDSVIYFINTPYLYSLFFLNIGEIYLSKREIEKAENYFRKSLTISSNNKIVDNYVSSVIQLCNIKLLSKQYDSALFYAEKAIEFSKKNSLLTYEKDGLLLKKQALENLNKNNDALKTINEYFILSDSIEKNQNIEGIKKSILKEKILEKERIFNKTLEEQNYRNKKEKVFLVLLIILLLVIVVILIYIYKLSITNKKIKEENITNELNLRNRELTSNMLLQAKNNDLFNNTIKELNNLAIKEKIDFKEIQSIISNIKQSINKNSYENFEYYFVKVHPEFFKNLIQDYPELTQQELRICAFIKLNLVTKDIASIMNVTPETIRSTKSRMKKKLNLSESEESITYFLSKY